MKLKLVLCLALAFCGYCHAAIIFPKAAEQYVPIAYRQTVKEFQLWPASFPKNYQTNNLELTMGHRCYVSDYKAVLSGKLLAAASSHGGWEYLILCGTNAVGLTSVDPDDKTHGEFGGFEFSGTGPPLPVWVALKAAEKLPQIKNHDYEFRFLWIGVDDEVQAIWLHGKRDDIIIPITHYPSEEWTAYRAYSESELTRLFKPHVEAALKTNGVLNSNNAAPMRQ